MNHREAVSMGMAKRRLEEKEEHERECPECGSTVWVNWGQSPNVHCDKCESDYYVVQCSNCPNIMHENPDREIDICSTCVAYAMRD